MMRLIKDMTREEALHFQRKAQRNGYQAEVIGFVPAMGLPANPIIKTDVPECTERSIRKLYEAN